MHWSCNLMLPVASYLVLYKTKTFFMKALFIALLFVMGISTASASDIQVSNAAKQSFSKSFPKAENVSWTKVNDIYKVSFTIDNRSVFAFFSEEGELSAATRYISEEQLSMALQADLKNYLADYKVHEIFEVNNESGTTYYATLVSEKKMIVLQSFDSKWSVYKKAKL